VLVANPFPSFMGTGKTIAISPVETREDESLYVGATGDGLPSVYFICGEHAGGGGGEAAAPQRHHAPAAPVGPGAPPMPLGLPDFRRTWTASTRSFRKHKIPCDGLWLDIDYMDRFKVFTFDKKKFSKPARSWPNCAAGAAGWCPSSTRG